MTNRKKLDVEKILSTARATLESESKAIGQVSELLNESFLSAVKLILEIPASGRVVVSGMGKAGLIGMKISATLASTGVPSYFLHPAEAVHGDLGRYTRDDLALIVSNSGETEELLRILPFVKSMGCKLIAITRDPNSTLGRHSDATIAIGRLEEAGPHGLAPTSSAAALLAAGDALAMAVLSEQQFSIERFAQCHPGGDIGRSLMEVSEIMRVGDELCIVPETALTREALHQIVITKNRPGAAAIVDTEGVLTGVLTDGDFRRCLDHAESFLDQPASQVMSSNPKTIAPNKLVQDALHLLNTHKIDQVIVVDDKNRPVGLVDIQDLLEVNLKHAPTKPRT